MKKILLLILIALAFVSTPVDAIYYNGSALTSGVLPDMISSTGYYLGLGGNSSVMGSNGKYGMFYSGSTSAGVTAYKSQSCFWMTTSSTQGVYYYDSTTDPRLTLSYSGTSILLNVLSDNPSIKFLSDFNLGTLISGTGVTSTDNHPTENVFCAVLSYVLLTDTFFSDGRYLYSISTFQYTSGLTIRNYYNFYADDAYDPIYGLHYTSLENLMNPLYDGTYQGRYDFYFESSAIASSLWYTPERNSYRLALISDLYGATNSGNLLISLPDYYNAEFFTGGTILGGDIPVNLEGNPSIDYSSCGFTEIGCYITKTVEFYTVNISFSIPFDSCSSGSTASGTLSEKMGRMISIINPIPPDEGTIICGLLGTGTIDYSQATQSGNIFSIYGGSSIPTYMKSTGQVAFGQNILDIIIILGSFIYIFKHRKNA